MISKRDTNNYFRELNTNRINIRQDLKLDIIILMQFIHLSFTIDILLIKKYIFVSINYIGF